MRACLDTGIAMSLCSEQLVFLGLVGNKEMIAVVAEGIV